MNNHELLNLRWISQDTELFYESYQMGKQHICSFKINKIQRHNVRKIYPYVYERIYAKRINKGINKEIGISTLFSKMMQVLYICTSFDINRTFFEKFKEYYGLVTNKFNRSIKAIRMNNGIYQQHEILFEEIRLEEFSWRQPLICHNRMAVQKGIVLGVQLCVRRFFSEIRDFIVKNWLYI